jgi:hypothetical protein
VTAEFHSLGKKSISKKQKVCFKLILQKTSLQQHGGAGEKRADGLMCSWLPVT